MTANNDTKASQGHVLKLQGFNVSAFTVCLLLAALTLLCYWPVFSHQFTCFDDEHYLFDSGYVAKGLTWSGTYWALQTGYFCNWHPLTWLSYMLDAQIYGMNPRGFLLTNLLFHIANSLLLFLLMKSMTRRLWPSAVVAALFAWHPLHVESVAWVSERKDVLSTFFFLLTIGSYFRYARERECSATSHQVFRYYTLSLLLFTLSLTSKQMVVTLPCGLLLLDFWPLNRISFDPAKLGELRSTTLVLLREKLPFFALAFAASAVAFAVQKASGSVSSIQAMPIQYRFANALFAYVDYLADTFWPTHLAAVYPMSFQYSVVAVSAAAILLGGVSAFVAVRAKQNPFLTVGWFWFVGTLVPVIGIIQVGAQSRADRYMYIPSIGLFIALIWGIDALCRHCLGRISPRPVEVEQSATAEQLEALPALGTNLAQPFSPKMQRSCFRILAYATVAVLVACLLWSRVQVGYWRDSETVFRRAVIAVPGNYLGYSGLGKALGDLNRKKEAIQCLREAVRLSPGFFGGQYNLATLLLAEGEIEEAIPHFQIAVKAFPSDPNAHYNLGYAYFTQGKLREATPEFAEAAALNPDDANFRLVLGSVLLKLSRWNEAESVLIEAVRLDPTSAEANRFLGIALLNQGKAGEATRYLSEAVRLQPANSDSRFNLGLALLGQSQPAQAAVQFEQTLRLSPSETRGHYLLAVSLSKVNNLKDAVFHYREALRMNPEFAEALNDFAHLLACASDADLRDGTEAVELAEKACGITNHQEANMLTTLAAAYAEAGRFQDATATAQMACNLATSNGESAVAAKAGELLELSQAGRPLRE